MGVSSGNLDISRQSDVDLARLCLTGDRAAFAELVRRHGGTLRTHLRRMGAQGADADDMVQEAFLVAYERLNEYRFEGPLIAWLKRIAARRYLRKAKGSARYLLTDDMSAYDAAVDTPTDEGFKAHNLDAALARLKPAERLCVTLSFSGGLSHQDIADETGLPLGTVKSHIKRALDQLKRILSSAHPSVQEPRS